MLQDSIKFKWAVKGVMLDHCDPYIVNELPDVADSFIKLIDQRLEATDEEEERTKLVVAKAILLYAKCNIVMMYAAYEYKPILGELSKMREDHASLEKAQPSLAKYLVKSAFALR